MPDIESEIADIAEQLTGVLVGKDKCLTIVAALSIAATTAHMVNMSKIELQTILILCYDRRLQGK